jgi:YaiO family outer membrane protein
MKLLTSAILLAGSIAMHSLSAQEAIPSPARTVERTSFGADLDYVTFNGEIDPWTLASVSLGRRDARGSLVGRVNIANRFSTTGAQVEADAYPSLGASTYAYLNAGYSNATIFPEWRFGGEVFTNLPNAYEASLGFRQLRFSGSPVTLFTGSVGKYIGNYWLSARPYIRSRDAGLSASAALTVRRYYETSDEYIGARISYGSAASDRVIATELARLSALAMDVHGSRELAKRLFGTWLLGYEREEIVVGRFRNRLEIDAGMRVDF